MHFSIDKVTFKHPEPKDFALILSWFYKPHVQAYFDDPVTGRSIPDLKNFLSGKDFFFMPWLAFYDATPLMYLMTTEVTAAEDEEGVLSKWRAPSGKTYTLDVMIGNEDFLGMGIAHLIIQKFIHDIFPNASAFLIDPEKHNHKAVRVYQKAGFVIVDEFSPDSGQFSGASMYLMKLLVHRNQYHDFSTAEENFFSILSAAKMSDNGLIAFATGVLAANLNPVIMKQYDASFSKSITVCEAFYRQQNIPWTLIVPEYLYDDSMEPLLLSHALQLTDRGVAMALRMKDFHHAPANASLSIREVTDDLHEWGVPLISGFESTPEITNCYVERHRLAVESGARLYHFSGFIDGTIACSLSLSLYQNHARIDDVATVRAYQKKGFATELIHAALHHAQTLQADTCCLEASTVGLALYSRMGFKTLFVNRYYELVRQRLFTCHGVSD